MFGNIFALQLVPVFRENCKNDGMHIMVGVCGIQMAGVRRKSGPNDSEGSFPETTDSTCYVKDVLAHISQVRDGSVSTHSEAQFKNDRADLSTL